MSAQIAEALAKVAELHAALAEAYTELSGHYDAQSAKSGTASGHGTAGKVSGSGNKTAVGSKGAKAGAVTDLDELPEPSAPAGRAGGKAAAAKTTGGKGGKAKKVSEDDVRAAAKAMLDDGHKDEVLEVLGEFGASTLKELDEDHYAECLAKLEAKAQELATPEGGDENDGLLD